MRFFSLALVVAVLTGCPSRASADSITTCGHVVTGTASLDADLDCSAYADGPAVSIAEGTLFLNGFRLIGNAGQSAIDCAGPCKLRGPGSVEGGLHSIGGPDCTIRGATLDGAADDSVSCGRADIRNTAISGAGGNGFYGRELHIRRSSVSGCAERGVDTATVLIASRVDVRDCGGIGLYCFGPISDNDVRIRFATVENNGGSGIAVSISSDDIRISRSIIRGNRHGIWGNTSFDVTDCEISGNDVAGIYIGEGLSISDSSVTGNCLSWDPENWACCKDVWAEGGLDARKLTCGTSGGVSGGTCENYGACSLD